MKQLGLKSWATGALVLAAVSACGGTATDPPPTSSPATSTSAAPSSPTTALPSGQASAAAIAVVRHYFAVLDAARQNPKVPIARLASVMTSIELQAERRLVIEERAKGLHQTGETTIAGLKVQSIDLTNSDPSTGQVPTVVIDACWDVSNADLVDKDGKSVVSSTRPERGWSRYTVANYHWANNPAAGWRVAGAQDLKQAPCSAS